MSDEVPLNRGSYPDVTQAVAFMATAQDPSMSAPFARANRPKRGRLDL